MKRWTQKPMIGAELYANLYVSSLTQSIVDNGLVLVYMSNGSGGWSIFPVIEFAGSTSYFSRYTFAYSAGTVTIWKEDSDLIQATTPSSKTIKVVIIQGLSGQNQRLFNLFGNMDYNGIKDYFNLVE